MEQYVSFGEPETTAPSADPTADSASVTEVPDISRWPQVDFDRLSEINAHIVAWICIEGTDINYPVVQGSDNQYYLDHLFDRSYNPSGCIFLCRLRS